MSMTAARCTPLVCPPVRLVTFESGDELRAGVLDGDGIRDAGPGGVDALLRRGEAAQPIGPPVEDARLLPPIREPGKIILLGLNYRSHAEEAGLDAPETPTFFAKFANA